MHVAKDNDRVVRLRVDGVEQRLQGHTAPVDVPIAMSRPSVMGFHFRFRHEIQPCTTYLFLEVVENFTTAVGVRRTVVEESCLDVHRPRWKQGND